MKPYFIAVTKTTFEPEMREKALALAKATYSIFKKQPGLVSMHMMLSHDNTHTSSVFVWETKQNHEACMKSPDFEPTKALWAEVLQSGKANFELFTYDELKF
jgi:heme-degrading monooxygenase HmoA